MGCWNATDMVTGLPLMCDEPIRCFVIQNVGQAGSVYYTDDLWRPVGLPVKGRYNDYGNIEKIEPGLAADWLEHLLPLTAEAVKEIDGYGDDHDPELMRKMLAVERGHSKLDGKILTLYMVHEDTWQKMQTLEGEWRQFSEGRFKEDVERLRKLAKLPRPADDFLSICVRDLVRGFAPFMEKMWFWVKAERLDELINLTVEFSRFQQSLGSLRRCYSPITAQGAQHTDWEAHRAMAEMVIKHCNAVLKEEEQDE